MPPALVRLMVLCSELEKYFSWIISRLSLQRTNVMEKCYYSLFWIHVNFKFWMTRVSVCNPSNWNAMAGFLIHTTGTLKLDDDLKTTN